MEKTKDVALILLKLLDDIEKTISEPYHQSGLGSPPRRPLGIFEALMVKLIRNIPSDRELYRRLWDDENLRTICDIEEHENPYPPSQIAQFRDNVRAERLELIINSLVEELIVGGVIKGDSVALDATFINAWRKRDLSDDSQGFSDP